MNPVAALLIVLTSLAVAQQPPPPPTQPPPSQPPAQQQQPEQEETTVFKAGVIEVRLDVQVSQGRRLIADLNKDDFVVYDENTVQKLSYFGREAEPLTLILLLDVSGSMRQFIQELSRSAKQALDVLRPGDEVAIMVYGRRSKLHFDFSSDFEQVAGRLGSATDNPYVGSGTSTNEAIVAAAQLLAKRTQPGRKAIICVTDNGGLNYQIPDQQVVQELYNANAILNAIVVGRAPRPKPAPANANPEFTPTDVFRVADESGGETVRAERTDRSFTEIMERVRTRYALGYPAPAAAEAKSFRHVRVDLSPAARAKYPNAQIRSRNGYFAQ
jgi:VWFA-related protein